MAAVIPETLKKYVSAIRRAEELEKESKNESKVLAYYCRLYVVSKASKSLTTPEEKKFVIEQLGLLEAAKSSLKINENEGQTICKDQALAVFNKADEIDRMGLADKSTAKLFYAAGTFFEILDQFGEVDKDIQERKIYAKWKATDIINAINSGVLPTPGGFGEAPPDMGLQQPSEESSSKAPAYEMPPAAPTSTPIAPPSAAPLSFPNLPSSSQAAYSPVPIPSTLNNPYPLNPYQQISQPPQVTGYSNQPMPPKPRVPPVNNSDPRVKDSMEICLFAIAALKQNDIALARERLKEALRRIE